MYMCGIAVCSGNMSVVQFQARMTSSIVNTKRSCEVIHDSKLQISTAAQIFCIWRCSTAKLASKETFDLSVNKTADQALKSS